MAPDVDDRLVILAGGLSSRMKKSERATKAAVQEIPPQAGVRSKAMLAVGPHQRPFLDYLLLNATDAGYRDIVIVTGERDDSIRRYYHLQADQIRRSGLTISFAKQKIPADRNKPLGTADAFLQALRSRPDWRGQKVTVCNCDNLYSVQALKMMRETRYANAMVNYDRSGLQFAEERIAAFAVTRTDPGGFLVDIIEKPAAKQIEEAAKRDGYVGVSMNLWRLDCEMILPYLEAVPLHPQRQEKELPRAVLMMVNHHPQSVYAYPLKEHVPDLTSRDDLPVVRQYLERHFGA